MSYKDALRNILREAKRCTELINELLTLARSDAGTSRIELVSTDVAALLRDVVSEVMVLASNKGLKVLTKLAGSSRPRSH
jgi:signal transduction histidine kinase